MDVIKCCVRECPALPSEMLLAICQIFKHDYLDGWSTNMRDDVNKIRTSIRVNPYVEPPPEQKQEQVTKFNLVDHMLELTSLAQENAEHDLGIAYVLRLLEATSVLQTDLSTTLHGSMSKQRRIVFHEVDLGIRSLRSELDALRGIEGVHRSEIQPVTATVSQLCITRDLQNK